MTDRTKWEGTYAELLEELVALVRGPERAAEDEYAQAKSKYGKSIATDHVQALSRAAIKLKEAHARVIDTLNAKWPKAANVLSARLKKLGPPLGVVGIRAKPLDRHGSQRGLTILSPGPQTTIGGKRSSQSSQSSQSNLFNSLQNQKNPSIVPLGRLGTIPPDDLDDLDEENGVNSYNTPEPSITPSQHTPGLQDDGEDDAL